MSKGLVLTVGINGVDPDHYAGGWTGDLLGAESDAERIDDLIDEQSLSGQRFETWELRPPNATRRRFSDLLRQAAAGLEAGDLMVLFYAGHGGLVPNEDRDEPRDDTALCLFDAMLLDDELGLAWTWFQPDVRILFLADCCHSGTVSHLTADAEVPAPNGYPGDNKVRGIPKNVAAHTYAKHREFYRAIQSEIARQRKERPGPPDASILQISACRDDQLARELNGRGIFTSRVVRRWDRGRFLGSHEDFYKAVRDSSPAEQVPQLVARGTDHPTFRYQQRPFTI